MLIMTRIMNFLTSLIFCLVLPAIEGTGLSAGSSTKTMDPIVKMTETYPPSEGARVKGQLAQDVLLNCYVENRPLDMQVRWQRTMFDKNGRETTNQISSDLAVEDNMKWSIEKPSSLSWRLRIKSLRLHDEGNYTCYIFITVNQDRLEANRTVFAYDTPTILDQLSSNDMTVDEGESFIMLCNASGRPTPTIMWRRQGNAILPGGGVTHLGSQLPVDNVKYDARGMYICEAFNDVGRDRREIELSIRFSPKVSSHYDVVGQAVGYQRTIVCYVEAYPSPSHNPDHGEMYFLKDIDRIGEDDRHVLRILEGAYSRITFELVILRVEPEDYGEYTCVASNSMGAGSANVILEETDEPVEDKRGVISAASDTNTSQVLYTISLWYIIYAACRII